MTDQIQSSYNPPNNNQPDPIISWHQPNLKIPDIGKSLPWDKIQEQITNQPILPLHAHTLGSLGTLHCCVISNSCRVSSIIHTVFNSMLHRRSASNGSTWKEARTMLHTSKHAAFCWTTQGFGGPYCVSITHHSIWSWCLTKQCLLHLMVHYQFITKQSGSSSAHFMQYSGPAAAEQTQMDGSCWWQHWMLHPHGKLHMLLSSLLTRSLAMLVW